MRCSPLNYVEMYFAHIQYHQSVIDNTRAAEDAEDGRPLAIALDTKGPEIRTGNTVGDQDIPISAGHEMIITTNDECTAPEEINCL